MLFGSMNTRQRFINELFLNPTGPLSRGWLKCMNENNTVMIQELCDSFRIQLGFYSALNDTAQRILSKLILSRGDLSGLKNDFADKKRFLDQIEGERQKTAGQVKVWQDTKALHGETVEARELDGILRETEKTIRTFLDGEEQLKKHLERILNIKK
jgi:hypothetical protein